MFVQFEWGSTWNLYFIWKLEKLLFGANFEIQRTPKALYKFCRESKTVDSKELGFRIYYIKIQSNLMLSTVVDNIQSFMLSYIKSGLENMKSGFSDEVSSDFMISSEIRLKMYSLTERNCREPAGCLTSSLQACYRR